MLHSRKRTHAKGRGIATLFVSVAMVGTIGLAGCGSSGQGDSSASSSSQQTASSSSSSAQQTQAPADNSTKQGAWVVTKVRVAEYTYPVIGNATVAERVVTNTLDEHGNTTASKVSTTFDGEGGVSEIKYVLDEKGFQQSMDVESVSRMIGNEANKTETSFSEKREWKFDDEERPISVIATRNDGTTDITTYEYSDTGYISKRTHEYTTEELAEDGSTIKIRRSSEMSYNELGFPTSEHTTADVEGGVSQTLDATYEYKNGENGKPASSIAKSGDGTNTTSFSYDKNGNLVKQVEDIERDSGTKRHRETTREYEYIESPAQWNRLLGRLVILG